MKKLNQTNPMSENLFYKDGYKAQVVEEFTTMTCIKPEWDIVTQFYSIETTGLMTIRAGYAFDFATGAFDTKTIIKASAIHDVGCQAIVDGLLDRKHKKQVDLQFKIECQKDGMHPFRVWYTFKAVDKYSCRGRKKLVKSAPDPTASACFNDTDCSGVA